MNDLFYHFFHPTKTAEPIRHHFGRGINAHLNPNEPQLFNQSIEAFREAQTLQAYQYYLQSLENFNADDSNQNIILRDEGETLHFKLFQGSAIVHGSVTEKTFTAYAVITTCDMMNVAIKRHILERNDQLTYVSYCTDKKELHLKLYLDNTTMTPQKIFYPLRELALNADYEKEYLHYYFKQPSLSDTEHLEYLDEQELHIKYKAMQNWVQNCQKELEQLPSNDNNTTVSFTLLTLIFQIDYLLVPRVDIMQEIFEKINSYFNNDERLLEQKNDELLAFVEKLKNMTFTEFKPHFYKAKQTFAPTEHTTIDELNQFIEGSLEKYRWFKQNRYTHVASTINHYIPLYILYNYGIHPSYKALLHLLIEVQNSDFFRALGYKELYDPSKKSFNTSAIITIVKEAIEPYQEQFNNLTPFGEALNYTTLEEFSHSFILNLKSLDYTEL